MTTESRGEKATIQPPARPLRSLDDKAFSSLESFGSHLFDYIGDPTQKTLLIIQEQVKAIPCRLHKRKDGTQFIVDAARYAKKGQMRIMRVDEECP